MNTDHSSGYRNDIQGLRGWAVMMVLVFHLWPDFLGGGFVGVDVFFVISGFLITGMLIKEAEQTGTISIGGFYARRIRRLLPMAGLVLFLILVALPLIPKAYWGETSLHVLAGTFYVENLWLAHLSTDYLGAEDSATPVQHYWSLSVEEQFYIFWPLLIMGVFAVARKGGAKREVLSFGIISFLTFFSFLLSIVLTETNPRESYFLSHTRFWELGMGGVAALSIRHVAFRQGVKTSLVLAGMALIILSAVLITPLNGFPGRIALFPVLGAFLVLLAGGGKTLPERFLLRPSALRYTGDISYSLYLWHWPLIILWKHKGSGEIDISSGVLVLVLTFLLAALSKRFIEDYFIKSPYWKESKQRSFLLGVVIIAATALMSSAVYLKSTMVRYVEEIDENHLGAMALVNGTIPADAPLIPPLSAVKDDLPDVYKKGCHISQSEGNVLKSCHAGPEKSNKRIFLIGDSHAAQWWPALQDIASRRDWSVLSYTRSACAPLDADFTSNGKAYTKCHEWGRALNDMIKRDPPDIIIYAQSSAHRIASIKNKDESQKEIENLLKKQWQEWASWGIDVVAIRETPWMKTDLLECVGESVPCYSLKEDSIRPDPVENAAKENTAVLLIDMNDAICEAEKCKAVVGNIIVWRDKHHLTATYVRSMAPVLESRINKKMKN